MISQNEREELEQLTRDHEYHFNKAVEILEKIRKIAMNHLGNIDDMKTVLKIIPPGYASLQLRTRIKYLEKEHETKI